MKIPVEQHHQLGLEIPWNSCFLVKQHHYLHCWGEKLLLGSLFHWGDLAEGCFVSHKTQCSALVTSASHHSLCFTSLAISNCRVRINHNWPELMVLCHAVLVAFPRAFTAASWLSSAASCPCHWSLTGMTSHKLYARSRLYASARTPRNWRSSFAFFVPFRRHFNDKQLPKGIDLRVFSWGLHSAKIRKSALGSNGLSTLPLKTEVEILGGCACPSCPSRVTPLARLKEYLRKKEDTVVCCSRKPSFLNAKYLSIVISHTHCVACTPPVLFQVQPETTTKKASWHKLRLHCNLFPFLSASFR